MGSSTQEEVNELRTDTNNLFKIVFERLDSIETEIKPYVPSKRKKIGLKKE